jgi:hypothetical protein
MNYNLPNTILYRGHIVIPINHYCIRLAVYNLDNHVLLSFGQVHLHSTLLFHARTQFSKICAHTCTHTHTHVHTHMYACTQTRTHIYKYINTCIDMHTRTHTHFKLLILIFNSGATHNINTSDASKPTGNLQVIHIMHPPTRMTVVANSILYSCICVLPVRIDSIEALLSCTVLQ